MNSEEAPPATFTFKTRTIPTESRSLSRKTDPPICLEPLCHHRNARVLCSVLMVGEDRFVLIFWFIGWDSRFSIMHIINSPPMGWRETLHSTRNFEELTPKA
ncbi:hypothetical protein CEXT_793761 [Caerostris extrusa]|uniref:Uncharacterized protein n=1 Tax=Caerostris extrusa TaxID=172846 RepID=A0AAV4T9E8_CAEEX|nr:hypothetical protein CEXT_793761 [Caerostris extrusa]